MVKTRSEKQKKYGNHKIKSVKEKGNKNDYSIGR